MKQISKGEGKVLNSKYPEHITRTVNKYFIDETSEAARILASYRSSHKK